MQTTHKTLTADRQHVVLAYDQDVQHIRDFLDNQDYSALDDFIDPEDLEDDDDGSSGEVSPVSLIDLLLEYAQYAPTLANLNIADLSKLRSEFSDALSRIDDVYFEKLMQPAFPESAEFDDPLPLVPIDLFSTKQTGKALSST